jgi:hypothetical protein
MITNEQLQQTFVSPRMRFYFHEKLAPLPPDEIDARVEEVLKYLNMAIFFEGYLPVSKEIDDVWHYWILETAEYADLCSKLQGRVFFHHTSAAYISYVNPEVYKRPIDLGLGITILSSYVLNYGPFRPDRVKHWPLAVTLMERLGWDLDELNRRLGATLPAAPPKPVQARPDGHTGTVV